MAQVQADAWAGGADGFPTADGAQRLAVRGVAVDGDQIRFDDEPRLDRGLCGLQQRIGRVAGFGELAGVKFSDQLRAGVR